MANFNFNKVILGGRLASDPELKTTPSGVSVCTFSMAVTRRHSGEDKQTDFINIVAWRQTAEFISNYFSKGSSICIVGQLQTRSYTDRDGKTRYVTEVIADEAMFVDSKAEADGQRFSTPAENSHKTYEQPVETNEEEDDESDLLPF